MNEKTIIHCDKCNSTDILHGIIQPEPVEVHKTMSEMVNKTGQHFGVPAVYYYTQYSMTCKDCGHQARYSE